MADTDIQFFLGTLPDRRVLVDFRRHVDHLKLTPEEALALAEGLIEAATQAAKYGRHIITGGGALNPDPAFG